MPPVAHRGNSWQGYARTYKHRRMCTVALVTAGHTAGLRGRKLRMELKNQTWLRIRQWLPTPPTSRAKIRSPDQEPEHTGAAQSASSGTAVVSDPPPRILVPGRRQYSGLTVRQLTFDWCKPAYSGIDAQSTHRQPSKGATTMFTNKKAARSVLIVLGVIAVLGTASAARAGSERDEGFGYNDRTWAEFQEQNRMGATGNAYGLGSSASQQDLSQSPKKSRAR
jgi:hypothetical protein